LQESEK
jgi:ubiquitin C-terminal hydrolase